MQQGLHELILGRNTDNNKFRIIREMVGDRVIYV